MSDLEKICHLVSLGLTYEEAEKSWALQNWEEARQLEAFFDAFIGEIRATLPKA